MRWRPFSVKLQSFGTAPTLQPRLATLPKYGLHRKCFPLNLSKSFKPTVLQNTFTLLPLDPKLVKLSYSVKIEKERL